MDYAVQEGIKTIEWLENFTNVPFLLPRLQMLAVPSFQFLAMGNYGLLIFKGDCTTGQTWQKHLKQTFSLFQRLSFMRLHINGPAILFLLSGVMLYGLMKALQQFFLTLFSMRFIPIMT